MARKTKQDAEKQKLYMILAAIAVFLVVGTAAATTYFAKSGTETAEEKKTAAAPVRSQQVRTVRQVQALPPCNDGNIVGKVLGGVGGGALASNVGKGKGKTAATIGGTLGGAYLGGEAIPTHNVTCR